MYKILDCKLNKKYWKKILDKNNINDILYFPEYLMLWELNGDGIAKNFFYKCDYGIVLYPFLIRKINDLEFFQQMKIDEIFYDITSPYGYGGPLVKPYNKSDKKLLLEGFIKEFSLFCKKNNIVSEFTRFHPLMENHANFIDRLEIEKMNSIIYVDLSVSEEELWACTTCNACVQECPVNIDHPKLIIDMRRYMVMEKSKAPGEINSVFSNIENNGAPWQFSQDDRMEWAKEFMEKQKIDIPVMADLFARNEKPEYLFWIGSAGAFDDRYKNVTRAFIKILTYLDVSYAVLGTEESSSGDVARRAGNEMLFQMQAMMNIKLLNDYGVKKIITCDPHVYNTFLNEYPDFGANFKVVHHSQFLEEQIDAGNLKIESDIFADNIITYHDPCYLGRINGEYSAPRKVLDAVPLKRKEMRRNKSFALCCGAGGGQMFKEAEKGDKEIFIERTEEALETGADIIATACPYCMVMFTDGLKYKNKEENIKNYDIAEILVRALGI